MLNRSEILRTAWASYRKTAALIGLAKFSRRHFACALLNAWADAKLDAHMAYLAAEEAAEAAANPVKADARAELFSLNMLDRWTDADRARVSSLNAALAA